MLTKEELLQKGIPEDVADEIIAAAEADGSPENSLQTLEKALNDMSYTDDLFKAKGGDEDEGEDEEEEEYDEKFMKKMKRYMKENKSAAGKMAKAVGVFSEEMEKAISSFDTDAEAAVIEMADLKPILDGQSEFNDALSKAVAEMSETVVTVQAQNAMMFDLLQKAAAVQVETAKGLDEFLATPSGRKGVTANVEMQKAATTPAAVKTVYSALMKATQAGDQKAGMILSNFESVGKQVNRLNASQRQYINDLISGEGK